MVAPFAGYVPLVLDPSAAPDGTGAQILEIIQVDPGDPLALPVIPPSFLPLTRLFAPVPSRKGRMKVALTLQLQDDGGSPPVVPTEASLIIRVRSPFTSDNGAPPFAPTTQLIVMEGPAPVGVITPVQYDTLVGPSSIVPPATLADVNANPSFGFSPTFQGKPIPNWSFMLAISGLLPNVGFGFVIDWHASVGS